MSSRRQIREGLVNNDPTYGPLRTTNLDGTVELLDDSFTHQLLFGSSSPVASTSEPQPSNSTETETELQKLKKTLIIDGKTKQCPMCTRVFKDYPAHSGRRSEFQCCVCWEDFGNIDAFGKHLIEYPYKSICCSCKKAKPNLGEHAKYCYNRKNRSASIDRNQKKK